MATLGVPVARYNLSDSEPGPPTTAKGEAPRNPKSSQRAQQEGGQRAKSSLARQFSQIKEALIMNPELRPYFYSGREFAGGDDGLYQRLASIAEIFLDMFEILILNRRQFPKIFAEDTWHRFMLGIFEASPFLCDYLETAAKWYTRELLDTMLASSASRRAVPTTTQAPENRT